MRSFVVEPATKPLAGLAPVPGDKSIGHRSLLLGAVASGTVSIRGLSDGADNRSTRAAIVAMGVKIESLPTGEVVVSGVGLDGLSAPTDVIDCGNSGTTMRLLCGLLAGQAFPTRLVGDESLSRRPMRRVGDPLALMGARIEGEPGAKKGEIYPPLRISGTSGGKRLTGIDYRSPIASAQVKSAVLLAGLYATGTTVVREPRTSRDHTERMLAYMGAPIRTADDGAITLDVAGWDRELHAERFDVPGDPSAAAFMVAAALIVGCERVAIADVCLNPTRAGFLDVLSDMGALIEYECLSTEGAEKTATLVISRGAGEALSGTIVSGDTTVRAIDELPVLAVVAARASGVTHFRDAAELRIKESDRIATTVAMLRAFGVEVEEQDDGFSVHGLGGAPFASTRIDAAGDHRIAMSAAVAALGATGTVRIDDVDNVVTSFPRFVDVVRQLGGDIRLE